MTEAIYRSYNGDMKNNITADYLKTRLIYDPETGEFVWKYCGHKGNQWNSMCAGKTAGTFSTLGYGVIRIDNIVYLSHRLAWLYMTGEWPTHEIDHIDHDPGNNRYANLRPATRKNNGRNRKLSKNNAIGIKGVCRIPRSGKWQATITVNGKHKHLGSFCTPEEAGEAYAEAARKFFGEFACPMAS